MGSEPLRIRVMRSKRLSQIAPVILPRAGISSPERQISIHRKRIRRKSRSSRAGSSVVPATTRIAQTTPAQVMCRLLENPLPFILPTQVAAAAASRRPKDRAPRNAYGSLGSAVSDRGSASRPLLRDSVPEFGRKIPALSRAVKPGESQRHSQIPESRDVATAPPSMGTEVYNVFLETHGGTSCCSLESPKPEIEWRGLHVKSGGQHR
jgi:hypothetical protein